MTALARLVWLLAGVGVLSLLLIGAFAALPLLAYRRLLRTVWAARSVP